MVELKQMDVGFGDLAYFEWPCGHQFNQTQQCPVCADIDQTTTIIDRVAAFGAQIEKRDQVLRECRELFSKISKESVYENRTEIAAMQIKINEVCPRSKPFAHLTPEQLGTLRKTALVWDSIIGWLDQPGIPEMDK